MQTMAHSIASTAEQLLELQTDGTRYELIQGELSVMSPVSFTHGETVCRLVYLLMSHLETKPSGRVVTETGFILHRDPDHVVAPDLAFVREENAAAAKTRGFVEGVPDLVAEVLSPEDRLVTVGDKVSAYLDAGVSMILIIDPWARRMTVYRSHEDVVVLNDADTLDAQAVVSGWTLSLSQLFGD